MKDACPVCGSESFYTISSMYDTIEFNQGHPEIISSKYLHDEQEFFCENCNAQLDFDETQVQKRIVIRNPVEEQ